MTDETPTGKIGTALDEVEAKESETVQVPVNPNDPYINLQDYKADGRVTVATDHNEEQVVRTTNMIAKEKEINAPGTLTQAEANKLAEGMPPEKVKEIQMQVMEISPEDRAKIQQDIREGLGRLTSDPRFGRNEVIIFLHELRQEVASLEQQMLRNF